MDIKSNIEKKMKWKIIPYLNLRTLFMGITIGLLLGFISIAAGTSGPIKVIFLGIMSIGLIVSILMTNDEEKSKKKEYYAEQVGFIYWIFIVLLTMEIPLYFNSNSEEVTPVTIIKEVKVNETKKSDCNEDTDFCEKVKVSGEVTILSLQTNSTITTKRIGRSGETDMEDQLKKVVDTYLHTFDNVVAIKTTIKYIPFIKYYEEETFVRGEIKK